jgi:hypothetical protein
MLITDVQPFVQMVATLAGLSGGLFGLYKYFSDKREKELREWQKVVIYKIFRQKEMEALSFSLILEKYQIAAQAFIDIDLKKKEISEDALRRVLLELASSGILTIKPLDAFQLKVVVDKPDPLDKFNKINQALVEMVAKNPYVYTLDEVLKEIAPKVGEEIPLLRTSLKQSIAQGIFVVNKEGKIAFSQ